MIVTDTNGHIIQVNTSTALAVITKDSTGYTVAMYDPASVTGQSGGVYQLASGAVAVAGWRVDASTFESRPRLTFRQMVGNVISGKTYIYTSTVDGRIAVQNGGSTTETVSVSTTINGQPAYIITETPVVGTTRGAPTIRKTYSYLAAAPYAEKPISVDYPNGSRESYDYAAGSYDTATHVFTASTDGTGDYLRTITTQGAANDTTPLIANRSTRTTRISDNTQRDNTWSETFEVYNGSAFQVVNTTLCAYDTWGNTLTLKTVDGRTVYSAALDDYGQKTSETDETGVITGFTLGDDTTTTKRGVAASGTYPAQPDIVTTSIDGTTTVTSGTLSRITVSTDTTSTVHGLTTTFVTTTDSSGNTVETTTHPGTGTEIRTSDPAGRLLTITGTAVTAEYHTYGTNADGSTWERVDYGTATSANYLTTTSDVFGRTIKEERPAFAVTGSATATHHLFYNAKDQLWKETNTGQADRLTEYDSIGAVYRTGLDLNGNGTLDIASGEPIQQTETAYALESGVWYRVTTRSTYRTVGSGAASTVATMKERLTLPTTMLRQTISMDAAGSQTTSTVTVDRDNALVTETTTSPGTTNDFIRVTRNGLLQSAQAPYQTQPVTYTYDDLGRLHTTTDPRSGTVTTNAYTLDDQPESVTQGSGTGSLVSGVTYFQQNELGAGQVSTRTEAGRTTHYTYDLRGNVLHTWGDTYPVQYEYDSFGRLHKLHTFQVVPADPAVSTWADGDITTWNYDEATGLLVSKTDAYGLGPTYTYWPSGNLKTRTWARTVGGSPLVANYAYYDTGFLQGITYSDSTPSVTVVYARDGQPDTLTDAAGSRTFDYDTARRASGETYSTGELAGLSVSNPVDAAYRASSLTASNGTTPFLSVNYAYQPTTGLLDTVTKGTYTVVHGFADQSNYLSTLTHKIGGTTKLSTSRTPDFLGRVGSVATQLAGASGPFASYAYHYDEHNQRDTVTLADASLWTYGYDSRGQVQSGSRTTGTQPVPGQAFAYTYDTIGNRRTTTTNGRSASYTPDELNRYTQREVPGTLDITGAAATDARVAVNNVLATRTGDRFYAAVPANNTSAPAYPLVDVVAVHQEGGADVYARLNTGHLFLAQTPEAFEYDDDGNLTQDGRWTYTWDAENRLTGMETRTDVATILSGLPRQKLAFGYDAYGRRIVKKVSAWSGSAWVLNTFHRFVYDGWNLVAEVDALASNAPVGTYVWGLDLSGAPQGAGGVGGLLLATVGDTTYAPAYDGNGNIMAWADLASGSLAGQREYGPFGEALRISGSAGSVPFGFSSKYTDKETGLAYYGLRYLNVSTGRWLGRDPIEEGGGLNLYGMVENDPIGYFDPLGLIRGQPGVTDLPAIMRANGWVTGAALMDYWFAGSGVYNSTDVTMSWALGYARAKTAYDQIFSQKLYATASARREIVKLARKYGASSSNSGIFGSASGSSALLDSESIQYKSVGSMTDPVDDMYAALGKFNFRVLVEGKICGDNSITLRKIGVYIKDSYDFKGDQFLGFWNKSTNYGGKNPFHGFPINNSDFQKFGGGADFLIFSDIVTTILSPEFTFTVP
ncbi:MAG: DUF6402 family protein [Opitutaceae bacterium]